ncbi:hypothetical protein LINPERPRIM_LOCUS17740 [Linum perenne]
MLWSTLWMPTTRKGLQSRRKSWMPSCQTKP